MTGPVTLGGLLRQKKKDYGFEHINDMAAAIGIDEGYLYRLLRSNRPRLSTETKYRLCLALDIAPRVMEEVVGR